MEDSALFKAIRNRNVDAVRKLLKARVNVNEKTVNDGNTPLHVASRSGNKEILKLLLKAGADVKIKNKHNCTPLGDALIDSYNFEVIKLLVQAGADVDDKNDLGQSALHYAAKNDDLKLIEYLLSKGADVNIENKNAKTPLHLVSCKNLKVIEALLENCADVNAPDTLKDTPFHYLVERVNLETIEELLLNHEADVRVKNSLGETPLFRAISRRKIELVQLLIKYGSDVNSSNNGSMPLHEACKQYMSCEDNYHKIFNADVIKCLLKNGANANALDSKRSTPLRYAVENFWFLIKRDDSIKTLRYLLKYVDFEADENNVLGCSEIINAPWVWKAILEHVAKCKVLDIPLGESILDSISKKDEYKNYFQQCLTELSAAKSTKLQHCWVTFFDLLVDNDRKLKNYAGNSDLVTDFMNSNCTRKFPIYGASMRKKMVKGLRYRKLFDASSQLICRYLPIFKPWHLIVRDIFDCVPKKDL